MALHYVIPMMRATILIWTTVCLGFFSGAPSSFASGGACYEFFRSGEKSIHPPQLKRSETVANLTGYAILGTGIFANSALSAWALSTISPQLEFVPLFAGSFIGQMSFVSVSLLAPFLEPVSSSIRRKVFELKKRREAGKDETHSLEEQADRVHATYTLREQHATDRVISFRNAIRLNMREAAQALERRDENAVIAEVADAAMLGYRHFRDISPREETVLQTVRVALVRHMESPEAWVDRVLQEIEIQGGFQTSDARTYYERLLRAWFLPR